MALSPIFQEALEMVLLEAEMCKAHAIAPIVGLSFEIVHIAMQKTEAFVAEVVSKRKVPNKIIGYALVGCQVV